MTAFSGKETVEGPFTLSRKGTLSWIESEMLAGYDFITHAFCTREGGVSREPFASLNVSAREGDDDDAVRRNWSCIACTFEIAPGSFRMVRQVHGKEIVAVEGDIVIDAGDDIPSADGIVTALPGVAIGVRTADCVPLLYADPRQRVVGVVHAGWRGTAQEIAAKAVEKLVTEYSCRRSDIRVAIGPAIGPCCYEVDEAVYAAMPWYHNDRRVFSDGAGKGHWMLDLVAANRLQLSDAGIGDGHIHAAGTCTSCNGTLFFSHRGEGGRTGRQLSFIMVRSQ